jgi:hypothetical protein
VVGAFLTVRLVTKGAPTDAATIPHIASLLNEGAPVFANNNNNNNEYAVFVSKGDGISTARTALGRSTRSAVDALTLAQRQLPAFTARHPWVKVDVVTQVIPVPKDWNSRDKLPNQPDWWFGFALNWDWAFSPDEVNSQVLVDYHDRLRWDRIGQYAPKRGLEGWPIPETTVDDTTQYDGFAYILTKSIFCDFSQPILHPIPLYHGHVMYPNLTSSLLLEKSKSAGRHLTGIVQKDGSMLHTFHPRSGTSTTLEQDHAILSRHAGTLYAMACLHAVWKDPDLLAALQRGLDYLLKFIQPCPIPYDSNKKMGKCLVVTTEQDLQSSNFGDNALTLLAIAQYMDATGGDTRYVQVARDLASFIVGSQKKDGSLVPSIAIKSKLELEEERALVRDHQGLATFCLAKLHRTFATHSLRVDDEWMTVASLSARYIVSKDAPNTNEDDVPNDYWLMYGIAEMHPIEPDPTLQQYALKTARVIQQHQSVVVVENETDGMDRLGIFYGGLSVTSTAMYTQGQCAIYDMATDMKAHDRDGDDDDAAHILDSVLLGVRYQLQAQHGPETAMHMKDPRSIVGAFHESIVKTDMRNDCTQHNLSSMLCLARILQSRGN